MTERNKAFPWQARGTDLPPSALPIVLKKRVVEYSKRAGHAERQTPGEGVPGVTRVVLTHDFGLYGTSKKGVPSSSAEPRSLMVPTRCLVKPIYHDLLRLPSRLVSGR